MHVLSARAVSSQNPTWTCHFCNRDLRQISTIILQWNCALKEDLEDPNQENWERTPNQIWYYWFWQSKTHCLGKFSNPMVVFGPTKFQGLNTKNLELSLNEVLNWCVFGNQQKIIRNQKNALWHFFVAHEHINTHTHTHTHIRHIHINTSTHQHINTSTHQHCHQHINTTHQHINTSTQCHQQSQCYQFSHQHWATKKKCHSAFFERKTNVICTKAA
jgi:hypothetical protein